MSYGLVESTSVKEPALFRFTFGNLVFVEYRVFVVKELRELIRQKILHGLIAL